MDFNTRYIIIYMDSNLKINNLEQDKVFYIFQVPNNNQIKYITDYIRLLNIMKKAFQLYVTRAKSWWYLVNKNFLLFVLIFFALVLHVQAWFVGMIILSIWLDVVCYHSCQIVWWTFTIIAQNADIWSENKEHPLGIIIEYTIHN